MARRRQTTGIVLIGVISILIGFVLGYLSGFKDGRNQNKAHVAEASSPQPLPASLSNPGLDFKSAEIIKELNCVCGCKMELSPCTCDEQRGSQEIRRFVQILVQEGVSRPEIIKRLIEKYTEAILIKKA
jgi:cytochrome c-type biogenesis protein CcmH/NrfF